MQPHRPENRENEVLIEASGLVKRFGRQTAVDGVGFKVRRGDVFGFLGLNGAGKTTTLRMIVGLLRPDAGSVRLFGEAGGKGRLAALARIGAMIENPAFYDHLSGAKNLQILGALAGPLPKDAIDRTLDLVGLSAARAKRARDYSLGMKQRLGLALALLTSPELVILDEPTNGLDPNGILEMRRLIRRLNEEFGTTFLISSHLLHEIERTANRVAILERGRLVVEEDVDRLIHGLGCEYVLAAAPIETARSGALAAGCAIVSSENDGALIRFTLDAARLPDLHAALVDANVRVRTLSEERRSLEDYFLATSTAKREGALS